MSRQVYCPTPDGYTTSVGVVYAVYQTFVVEGIRCERIAEIFDWESYAVDHAKELSATGDGVRVVEIFRIPEVSVR